MVDDDSLQGLGQVLSSQYGLTASNALAVAFDRCGDRRHTRRAVQALCAVLNFDCCSLVMCSDWVAMG